jgi:hypothetical protein
MAESEPAELSKSYQNLDSETIDEIGVEAQRESISESSTETSVKSSETEKVGTQASTTRATRPKLQEKANSYVEERKDTPSTQKWMSLLHRNLAANPGSSAHNLQAQGTG